MPRQIDLFNQNFQVNHNPNNRLSFSSQQVTAMQNQLPNLIAQAEQEAITKILELIDQETGLDLVGLQQWLNQLSASLSQSWLNFQNFLNGLAQETDAEVTQALTWLNNQFASINTAITQVNTDITDIIDSFAPGGTVTEFQTGVTNLLAFFGLTPSDVGGATAIDSVWTAVINDIINPLNAIETEANNVIVSTTHALTDFFDWITGTTTPTSTTQVQSAKVASITSGGTSLGGDLLTHLGNVASVTGSSGTNAITAALNSLTTITNTVSALSSKVSGISIGQGSGGQTFQVAFSSYPAGAFSGAPFTTTYTGSGTGHLILSGSAAQWSGVNNGDVSVVGIFNNGGSGQAYTDTDYQELQASLAGYPNGAGSINFALLRCNSAGTDYVYGCIYLSSGFGLNWEIGSVIAGTTYVWASGTNAPLNLNFTFIAGVGTNVNRYQGISGDTVVFDHVNTSSDPGGVFPVGSTHRYWGFRSDTFNSGQVYPAPAAYVGCADNSPAVIPGSGVRQYCSSSSSVSQSTTANSVFSIAAAFFDTTANISSDITAPVNTGTSLIAGCTVTKPGRYLFEMRVAMTFATSLSMETICPVVERYNSSNTLVETRLCTALGAAFNVVGAQAYTSHFGGSCVLTMAAGDYILVGYYIDGPGSPSSLTFSGDAAGSQTWWDLTLMSA